MGIGALLLAPELIAFVALGSAEDDGNVLRPIVVLEVAASLKAVTYGLPLLTIPR